MRPKNLVAIISVLLVSSVYGQPGAADPLLTPHDESSAPKTISELPYTDRITTFAITGSEDQEPICEGATQTVWYQFTPTTLQPVKLSAAADPTFPVTIPVALAVYGGSSLDTLERVACRRGGPVWFLAQPSTTYWIQVAIRPGPLYPVVFNAERGTGIYGVISNQFGERVSGACVRPLRQTAPNSFTFAGSATTDSDGGYLVGGITSGTYTMQFGCPWEVSLHETRYFDDKSQLSSADLFEYVEGEVRAIDAVLPRRGTLQGTVTNNDGSPAFDVCVNLSTPTGAFESSTRTAPDGSYTLTAYPEGDYRIRFGCQGSTSSMWATEWYDGALDAASASSIHVSPGDALTGFDADVDIRGKLVGAVRGPGGEPMKGACISVHKVPSGSQLTAFNTGQEGQFEAFLDEGTYRLNIGCGLSYAEFIIEWYEDSTDFESATDIVVANGTLIGPIEIEVAKPPIPINDNRADAIEITSIPFVATTTVTSASPEEGETSCITQATRSVWFEYSPAEETMLFLDTKGGIASYIKVYEEVQGGLQSLDGCSTPVPLLARPGHTYLIQQAAFYGGDAVLRALPGADGMATTFTAPTPCTFACPYWRNAQNAEANAEAACQPNPDSPEGSYDERVVEVPDTITGGVPTEMAVHIRPDHDFDAFVCRFAPDSTGSYYVTTDANSPTQECPELRIMRCEETATFRVSPGQKYVIRVYNWLDATGSTYGFWTFVAR